MCTTRGGSWGMYISFASAKKGKSGRTHSGFETQRRRHQKSKTGVPGAPKKDMCLPKKYDLMTSFWKRTLLSPIDVTQSDHARL